MAVSLKDMIARQPAAERRKIEARTTELVAEEMTLRALRKAAGKTQVAVAAKLGVKQENVSRIEQRADLLLSTLSHYVRALGGTLRLTAEFAGKPAVHLSGFESLSVKAVRSAGVRGLTAARRKAVPSGIQNAPVRRSPAAPKRKGAPRAIMHAE